MTPKKGNVRRAERWVELLGYERIPTGRVRRGDKEGRGKVSNSGIRKYGA